MTADLADLLRQHGHQVTAQRLAVLAAVSGLPRGTADDVVQVLRAEIGVISPAPRPARRRGRRR